MTREEARHYLIALKDPFLTNDFCTAIDVAIEALEEQRTGKWIIKKRHEHYPSGREYEILVCPFCGRTDHNGDGNYCGYCGAKMEE